MYNRQAWYQAKWNAIYALPDEERIHVAIFNGLPRGSTQDKLDQKDEDYRMVSNETFLDYLYCLEVKDRQKRAKKQRLKESFAVETGCILKKDKKHKSHASDKGSSKKAKKRKYCDWCANHGKDDRFIHSHNEADCNFKKATDKEVNKKKGSNSGSGRSLNALKKEQKKIKKILRDDSLSSEREAAYNQQRSTMAALALRGSVIIIPPTLLPAPGMPPLILTDSPKNRMEILLCYQKT
jgi:hypothetical protein